MSELYRRRRDLVVRGAARDRRGRASAREGTIYVWAPVPEGFASSAAYCEHVLEQAAVGFSRPARSTAPQARGWFRISLTTPDDRLMEAVERLGALRVEVLGLDGGWIEVATAAAPQAGAPTTGSANGTELTQRGARQRRVLHCGRWADGDDLAEPRRASCCARPGWAVTGELIQRREPTATRTPISVRARCRRPKGGGDRETTRNLIACDDELTARQERNLEEAIGLPVVDRTTVILGHLRLPRRHRRGQAAGGARAARVQPRPHARTVEPPRAARRRASAREAPGETQIETDRRLARETRIATLRRRLEHVKGTRAVQAGPSARQRAELPTIALVGYTNAGKSTLLNAPHRLGGGRS